MSQDKQKNIPVPEDQEDTVVLKTNKSIRTKADINIEIHRNPLNSETYEG